MANCQIRDNKLYYDNSFVIDLLRDIPMALMPRIHHYPVNVQTLIIEAADAGWRELPLHYEYVNRFADAEWVVDAPEWVIDVPEWNGDVV